MFSTATNRPTNILLVEDNPGDVRLTQEALKASRFANRVAVVNDGEAALDYLHHRGAYVGVSLPDLILLDLNLPRVNGSEVLADIKADAGLRRIPVVIISTSAADEDVAKVYELHGNCYITKPMDLDQYLNVIQMIDQFWLRIATLPAE